MRVLSARTLAEALAALARPATDTHLLAGGTDLMVELHSGRTRPAMVIDLWRVDELRGIRAEAGGLRLGALTTCSELRASALARERADILVAAAREVGAVQIQNRATLGGNLGTASPAADLVPVLFALGARVELVSVRGRREIAVEDFVTGYRATARAQDELVASIRIPPRAPGERRLFRKVGTRRAQSIAKLVVALAAELDDGRVRVLRTGAGALAERTLRLAALERELAGRAPDPDAITRAVACCLREDVRPRDDLRSSADYRRQVLARILAGMLGSLWD